MISPRRLTAGDVVIQPAFKDGVDDVMLGRNFRQDVEISEIVGFCDSVANRQRLYECGRIVAIFSIVNRRRINAATAIAAKIEGYIP